MRYLTYWWDGEDCGAALWGVTYSYDQFGNMYKNQMTGHPGTTFNPMYNSLTNRYTSTGNATPTYDLNGNLTYDCFHTYGWDAEGNLIQIDGSTMSTMDAFNRRVEYGTASNFTDLMYAPWDPSYRLGTASRETVVERAEYSDSVTGRWASDLRCERVVELPASELARIADDHLVAEPGGAN